VTHTHSLETVGAYYDTGYARTAMTATTGLTSCERPAARAYTADGGTSGRARAGTVTLQDPQLHASEAAGRLSGRSALPLARPSCVWGLGNRGSSRDRLQVVAQDRARRHAASSDLEPGTRKGRGIAGRRRARRPVRIKWIRFERGGVRALCRFQRRCDQRRRDAPLATALAHVEAGERPDRHIVHALEPPRAIEPRQGVARREGEPITRPARDTWTLVGPVPAVSRPHRLTTMRRLNGGASRPVWDLTPPDPLRYSTASPTTA
jgi:hypothetical protein